MEPLKPLITIYKEHLEMRICPHCGSSNTKMEYQRLLHGKTGFSDLIKSRCLDCGKTYTKEFPLPKSHFKDLHDLVSPFIPPKREKLKERYEKLIPSYESLIREVEFILKKKIGDEKIRIRPIKTRVKKFDSFYKKIVDKEIKDDPFEVINDIAGVRVTCLYRSDLERIGKLIAANFRIIRSDTSRKRKVESFGYMADHYDVLLPKELRGARYDGIKSLMCEIQVRTVLMDSWATVSHHLDYKKKNDIPSELRKDFVSLSGLFYVADTHFDIFKDAVEKSKRKLMNSVKKGKIDQNQEINLDTLRAYLQLRFPNRKESGISAYSSLVSELKLLNYDTIKTLDKALNNAQEQFSQYEKTKFKKPYFRRTGVVRASLKIIDPEYRRLSTDFEKLRKRKALRSSATKK